MIDGTDAAFGTNSLTIDTSTGMEWLNLPYTDDLTYQQVAADMQPGGIFSGFRFATVQEVLGLYQSAGIPGLGYYPTSSPAISSFLSQIGAYSTFNGQLDVIGLTAVPFLPGGHDSMSIYVTGVNGAQFYWVNDNTAYGNTYTFPGMSSWLVQSVPETADASVYVIAAVALICGRFLLLRKSPA